MTNYKVGDKVRRVECCFDGMNVGDIGTISHIDLTRGIKIKEYNEGDGFHCPSSFELIEEESRNYKIKTRDQLPEQFKIDVRGEGISKRVQERLFGLECGWQLGGYHVQNEGKEVLFCNMGQILYGTYNQASIRERPWLTVEELFEEEEESPFSPKFRKGEIVKALHSHSNKWSKHDHFEVLDTSYCWKLGRWEYLVQCRDACNRYTIIERDLKLVKEIEEKELTKEPKSITINPYNRPSCFNLFETRQTCYKRDYNSSIEEELRIILDSEWKGEVRTTDTQINATKEETTNMTTFNFNAEEAVETETILFGVNVKHLNSKHFQTAMEYLKDEIKSTQNSIKEYEELDLGSIKHLEDQLAKHRTNFKTVAEYYVKSEEKAKESK